MQKSHRKEFIPWSFILWRKRRLFLWGIRGGHWGCEFLLWLECVGWWALWGWYDSVPFLFDRWDARTEPEEYQDDNDDDTTPTTKSSPAPSLKKEKEDDAEEEEEEEEETSKPNGNVNGTKNEVGTGNGTVWKIQAHAKSSLSCLKVDPADGYKVGWII